MAENSSVGPARAIAVNDRHRLSYEGLKEPYDEIYLQSYHFGGHRIGRGFRVSSNMGYSRTK